MVCGLHQLVPEIFDCIERISSGLRGELQLTDALALLAKTSPLYARSIEGTHYDAGSPLGLLEANLAFAMKDPQLAGPLRSQLKSLTDTAALHGRE